MRPTARRTVQTLLIAVVAALIIAPLTLGDLEIFAMLDAGIAVAGRFLLKAGATLLLAYLLAMVIVLLLWRVRRLTGSGV